MTLLTSILQSNLQDIASFYNDLPKHQCHACGDLSDKSTAVVCKKYQCVLICCMNMYRKICSLVLDDKVY